MRHWNKAPKTRYNSFGKFLLYLWGIETAHHFPFSCRFDRIFTLPMRHWNFGYGQDKLIPIPNFYSTYEALKPTTGGLLPPAGSEFLLYLWGIETQHYTASPRLHSLFLLYLWGIETERITALLICGSSFLLYLWGIETLIYLFLCVFCSIIFTLPMRHWNTSKSLLFLLSLSIFTLPMRHWNPPNSIDPNFPTPYFYSTYEALKLH